MVSIRMIVKSGQKNELQNLGFRTYYNHCGTRDRAKIPFANNQEWPKCSEFKEIDQIQLLQGAVLVYIVRPLIEVACIRGRLLIEGLRNAFHFYLSHSFLHAASKGPRWCRVLPSWI